MFVGWGEGGVVRLEQERAVCATFREGGRGFVCGVHGMEGDAVKGHWYTIEEVSGEVLDPSGPWWHAGLRRYAIFRDGTDVGYASTLGAARFMISASRVWDGCRGFTS